MDDEDSDLILEQCINDMLDEGLGVEACLRKHPSHKDDLRSLLQAVEILRPLRTLPVASEVKARILEHLKTRGTGPLS